MVICDYRYVTSNSLSCNTGHPPSNPITIFSKLASSQKLNTIYNCNSCKPQLNIQLVNCSNVCYSPGVLDGQFNANTHGVLNSYGGTRSTLTAQMCKNININYSRHDGTNRTLWRLTSTDTNMILTWRSSGLKRNSMFIRHPTSVPDLGCLHRPLTVHISKIYKRTNQIYNSHDSASKTPSSGQIMRLVLNNDSRQKLNMSSDRDFYSSPRFVNHVDDSFISALTQLYRERIPPGAEVLDLMSSWVSHLPPEIQYKRVVGHGLNAQELARNPRLDYFFVKDLNEDQTLEAKDCSFDAVLCTVSVQYLQQPEKVFAEIYRILRPGGLCIVSFSNRMFYEKAISAWRNGTDYSRTQLVVQYFQCVTGFTQPEIIKDLKKPVKTDSPFGWLSVFLRMGSDPFNAVIAHRNFKPI